MIHVVVVDDDPLVRSALRLILEGDPDIRVVGEGADGISGRDAVRSLHPEVVLMDLHMPRCDGVHATAQVVASGVGTRVLVLTAFDEGDLVLDALEAGATGFLLKDSAPADILAAVHACARGEARFTPSVLAGLVSTAVAGRARRLARPADVTAREWEVARLVARGLGNAEIAEELFLGLATVKTHVSALLVKLGAANRVQLAIAVLGIEARAGEPQAGESWAGEPQAGESRASE